MIRSVPLVDRPATRAPLARVSRIDISNGDACQRRLVGDVGTHLPEGPGIQAGSLTAAGRNPGADVLEIFKRNAATGAFGSRNDRLRNAMADVLTEPGLLPGEFLKSTLGGLCRSALEPGLPSGELAPDLLDACSAVGGAVAVRREIDDAEIDAKPILGVEVFGLRHIACAGQQPLAAHEAQIGLALAELQQRTLTRPHHDGNDDAAPRGPERHSRAVLDEAHDAIVVRLGGQRSKHRSDLAIDLERIRHLRNGADRCLRGQSKISAQVSVKSLVQVELPEHAGNKTLRRKPRTGRVAALKGLLESGGLFIGRQELDCGNELHSLKYRTSHNPKQEDALPPRRERRGFRARFLWRKVSRLRLTD